MPRRRADKVVEHRISLSDGLHKEMKAVVKTNKMQSEIAMVGSGAKGILNVAAVGGVIGVAYLGVKAYAEAKGIGGSIKSALEDAWDWSFGVKTNADGSIVPTTVNAVDADGNPITVTNPIYKVPILNRVPGVGGLFDWGMQLGATNNPFADNPAAASFVDKLTAIDGLSGSGRPPPRDLSPEEYAEYLEQQRQAALADRRRQIEALAQKRRNQAAANRRLAEYMAREDIGTSYAAGLEAQFREDYGDEFVDELLAADPDYFVPDFKVDVGPIDVDLSPDPVNTGQTPYDPSGPMNWFAWLTWVDRQGFGRIDKDVVVDGHVANLGWYHGLYVQNYNRIMGTNF
jgi:hypothetical protein